MGSPQFSNREKTDSKKEKVYRDGKLHPGSASSSLATWRLIFSSASAVGEILLGKVKGASILVGEKEPESLGKFWACSVERGGGDSFFRVEK